MVDPGPPVAPSTRLSETIRITVNKINSSLCIPLETRLKWIISLDAFSSTVMVSFSCEVRGPADFLLGINAEAPTTNAHYLSNRAAEMF